MESSRFDNLKPSQKISWLKWLGLALGAAALVGFGLFYFSSDGARSGGISLEFAKPDQIFVGQPFVVGVSFSNPSDRVLKEITFSLSLPDGISFLGQAPGQRITEQTIGDLGPGGIGEQSFHLIAIGGNQTLKRIDAKLSYKIAGSNAGFEERSGLDLVIGQPAISLKFDIPEKVVSGETFEIKLQYQNNSGQEFKNLYLKVDYPAIFKYQSATKQAERGNNYWKIGDLERGGNGDLSIRGSVIGQELSFFGFNAALTADFSGETYTVNTQSANLEIASSPISVSITANGSPTHIARIGESVTYSVNFRNNSETTFENITVRAKFVGELFDFTTAGTDVFLNSLTNTFTWTLANTPTLARLAPGESGSVALTIRLKDNFPARRLSDKNYTLKVQAEVESPTVPIGTTAPKTLSITALETKVAGKIGIDTKGYFRDASSGILNSGPYPPRVNQPTQYTIHWIVTTEAADFKNIRLTSFLQSGSKWTGILKSNVDTQPAYDPSTGRVTWEITNLPANKGIVGTAAEAVFQIENTPAVNQVGQEIVLLANTLLRAEDAFTGLSFEESHEPVSSGLPDDPTVADSPKVVQP